MFRKKQEIKESKPAIRPVDLLLDEAIKNYQLDEAKRLLHTEKAKIINPHHVLDIIFGAYDERTNKKHSLSDRYLNRIKNPPPIIYKPFTFHSTFEPNHTIKRPPPREVVINEIRPWIQFAIDAGCINTQHRVWGDTMLMWAIANKDLQSVKQLVVAKADPSIKNNLSFPAIHIAHLYNDKEIFSLINTITEERSATNNTMSRCHIL